MKEPLWKILVLWSRAEGKVKDGTYGALSEAMSRRPRVFFQGGEEGWHLQLVPAKLPSPEYILADP